MQGTAVHFRSHLLPRNGADGTAKRAPRGLGLVLRELCSTSAEQKGWGRTSASKLSVTKSSCTLLVTSSLTLLPAQILNPAEARRSGAFHHRKTNTLLVLSTAKLQNMTLGCSTNNRGKAVLF